MTSRLERVALLLLAVLCAGTFLLLPAQAATQLTVAQAVVTQDGASHTVRGYVVGQPTATNTVVTSGYPNDYALAIADSAAETSTAKMLYVQIPSAFRAQWGLKTNPSLKGRQIDVTGTLAAYFSHPGMTGTTAFAFAGATPTPTPTLTATSTPTPTPTATSTPTPGGGTTAYDSTYWAPAIGLSGAALKSSLHSIIDGHTTISYAEVWNALMVLDQDPGNANNVIEFYSGTSTPKTNNGGGVDNWNREHTWPQSHGNFGTSNGPGTDLFHLHPEDVTVNSERSNKDFDLGGTAVSQCPDCWDDADSFEPRDAVKGDLARGLFYMAVRYSGDDGWADLELNDSTNGSVPLLGKLSVLKQWNAEDPVTAAERARNDAIYETYQHNRNPFIDHPEWVDSIWS